MFVHISKKFKLKKSIMFLITVKNLNIILVVVYLVKKLIINNVAYTSKGSGVYVIWGWRIHPMEVAYTSNGPIRPKGRMYFNLTYTNLKVTFKHPKVMFEARVKVTFR